MLTTQGSLTILDLGTENPKYFWKGVELVGISKIFVYRGTKLTLTVTDKTLVPLEELKAYGIKVKEQK